MKTPFACGPKLSTMLDETDHGNVAGGGAGGLETPPPPSTFGQLGQHLRFILRTKRSQKRDIFKLSNAFPAI